MEIFRMKPKTQSTSEAVVDAGGGIQKDPSACARTDKPKLQPDRPQLPEAVLDVSRGPPLGRPGRAGRATSRTKGNQHRDQGLRALLFRDSRSQNIESIEPRTSRVSTPPARISFIAAGA